MGYFFFCHNLNLSTNLTYLLNKSINMGLGNNLGTVIHNLPDSDFENFVYYRVYASGDTEVTINEDLPVLIREGIVLDIAIVTIEANTPSDVFLIGSPRPYKLVDPFNIKTGIKI